MSPGIQEPFLVEPNALPFQSEYTTVEVHPCIPSSAFAFESIQDKTMTESILETDRYSAALDRCKTEIEPVELYGPAGSVIFWHHRLVHSGSKNRGTGIRSGVIYDFCADLSPPHRASDRLTSQMTVQTHDELCGCTVDKKPLPETDNTPLAEIARGNAADIWGDWSDEVRATAPAHKL